ncbi:MAG: class I SAM-dependent methyltransferase [Symploca sp. SIO1C2]|nr:class I SAM-dependent methyltransferase [Symploca sp. SIO1C2]
MTTNRGYNRERNLEKSIYYSDGYFQLHQLCSFVHQIHDIHRLKPTSILEVGIGNGFTSSFLRRAGFEVVTVDINPRLEPDICCPISEMQSCLEGRFFDLVVCCEVLEHMPFQEFESSINIFHSLSQRLYLTLPNYKRTFGVGMLLNFPKLPYLAVDAHLELPNIKVLDREHFWEVGSSRATRKKEIEGYLKKIYGCVDKGRYALNPYHLSFYAHSSN